MRNVTRSKHVGRSPRPKFALLEILEDRKLYSGSPYLHPTIEPYGPTPAGQHAPMKLGATATATTKPAHHKVTHHKPVHQKPVVAPPVVTPPTTDPIPDPVVTPPVVAPPVVTPPATTPPVTTPPVVTPPVATPPVTTAPPPVGPVVPPADSGTTTPPIAGNWTQIWGDEFNGTTLNPVWHTAQYWDTTTTVVGQTELEAYNGKADTVSNGMLHITATKDGSYGGQYLSGLVMTGGIADDPASPKFSFKYGYLEVRAKLPAGQGLWPAIWMMPASYQDGNGELDVMENLGNDMTTAYGTVHLHGQQQHTYHGADLSAGFHTFGMDWEPDHITWYIDGKAYGTTTDTSLIPTVAEYPIMNLAVGGSWGGNPDSTTPFPATMDIDYIRVWQKA